MKKRYKVLIALVVIVVLAVAAFFIIGNKSKNDQDASV